MYGVEGCGGFHEQDNSQHPNCHAVRQRSRSGGPWSRRRAGRTQEAGGRLGIALTVALFGATTAAAAIRFEPELCVGAETLAANPAFNSDEAPRVLRPRRGAVLRQRDILRVGSFEWLRHRPVIAGGAADAEPLAERCEGCRSSTASASLNRRAWHRAVGAKHAAVARLGLQPLAASLAVIEELAGVGGHPLGGGVAALRAGDGGLLNHSPADRTSVANGISQR